MKQLLWVAPLALALGMSGCEDILSEDPKSFLTTDNFYRTADDLTNATQGIYNSLRNSYGQGPIWASELPSDQAKGDPGEPNLATNGADFLLYDAAAGLQTQTPWAPLWQMIQRANLVLASAAGVEMNESQKAGLVAEAKYLRGFAYFQLLKRYSGGSKGTDLGVPLLLTPEDAQQKEHTRATQEAVFTQVLKDLAEAEPVLTVRFDGRASKGAAQMTLAEAYLWRSSFMGTNQWQQASDWAKKVIDSGQYRLNDGYFSTFLATNKGTANREMIFRVVGVAQNNATTAIPNTFYPRVLGFGAGGGRRGGFGTVQPTAWFLSSFATGDIRGTVGAERGTTAADYAADTVAFRNRGCAQIPGCLNFPPHVWKYRVVDRLFSDVDVPVYRYAEALLFYAEAQNELGNRAEAIRNVNLVRARARKGMGTENRAQPADLPTSLSLLQAREAVYMERSWELSFEGKRWFDLVRRDGIEPGYWASQLQAHDPNATVRVALQDRKKRWPIPQSEINVMPTLVQNPGY
jgi:starch-binding outer membrane protein, SusD/RagB family